MKVTVPTSLKDIKLYQYQKWLKVSDKNEDQNFLKQKMLEIFCNISLKDVLNIKAKDIDSLVEDINNVFKQDPKFIDRFDHNGKRFGFIPQLDNISFGEYVDLDNYLPEWETMDRAMGVLFRPVTYESNGKYLIEDYDGADSYSMREMSLDVVFGAVVFFWNLKTELLSTILSYLGKQTADKLPQGIRDFLQSGAGISQSMQLPRQTLGDLTKYQN